MFAELSDEEEILRESCLDLADRIYASEVSVAVAQHATSDSYQAELARTPTMFLGEGERVLANRPLVACRASTKVDALLKLRVALQARL